MRRCVLPASLPSRASKKLRARTSVNGSSRPPPVIRSDMRALLLDLQQELNKTIVFVTHDLEEAIEIGDRIAILRDGEIVQNGDSQDIVLRPADGYIAEFIQGINRGRVICVGSIMGPVKSDLEGPDCSCDMSLEAALPLATASPSGEARVVDADGVPVGAISVEQLVGAFCGNTSVGPTGNFGIGAAARRRCQTKMD